MAKTVVIIPAYKPDESYVKLVENLINDFSVLTVNDGSPKEYDRFFNKAQTLGAHVITHEVNKGKGAALKTAISHLMDTEKEWVAVTADADGQHSVKDIKTVARLTEKSPEAMVLGVRDFKQMPFRSRFGNTMTRGCFFLVTRNRIMDTQTGLRGFSHLTAPKLITADGNRYEYEMNVLLNLKEWGIPTVQTVIETIYEEGNPSSHFHPIRDSIMVFGQVIKHILASLICTALDYVLYLSMLQWTTILPEYAYLLSRVLSVILNYQLSKRIVFRAKPDLRTTIAYFMLALCMTSVGAIIVMIGTDYLCMSEKIVKVPVDVILFFVNFYVQKHVIFK